MMKDKENLLEDNLIIPLLDRFPSTEKDVKRILNPNIDPRHLYLIQLQMIDHIRTRDWINSKTWGITGLTIFKKDK